MRFAPLKYILMAAALLAACNKVSPDAGFMAAQPSTDPVKPDTAFTGALSCLDNLLRVLPGPYRGGLGHPVTVGLVPDATGRINPGLRDMVSNAVLAASSGSRYFVLIEAAGTPGVGGLPAGINPQMMGGLMLGASGGGPAQQMSTALNVQTSVQIIGSLSQADKSVQQTQANAGVGYKDSSVGLGDTSDFGAVVLDLRLVNVSSGQVLQTASNGLVIVNKGRSANAAIKLGSFGFSFDFSVDRREGPHQAIRTLTELAVLELLGKHAGVSYRECVSADRPSAQVLEKSQGWYDAMTLEQRENYARTHLVALGFAVDPPNSLTSALRLFQQRNGLVPTGRPGFETFAKIASAAIPPGVASTPIPAAAPPPATAQTLAIEVRESAEDKTLWLDIRLARVGHLACYYRDEHARVVKLFPNRYQSATRVMADSSVSIPPANVRSPFLLKPDMMNDGIGFVCLSAGRDVTADLPPAWRALGDFQQAPVATLAEVAEVYRQAAGSDLAVRTTTRGAPDGIWSK